MIAETSPLTQIAGMSPSEMRQLAETYEVMAGWADQTNRTNRHLIAENWRKIARQLEALERSAAYRMIRRAAHPHPPAILRVVS